MFNCGDQLLVPPSDRQGWGDRDRDRDKISQDRDWTGTRTPEEPGPGYYPWLEHRSRAFCKESKLCYSRWAKVGKPRQGPLLEDKLRSHALFQHAVRRVKRCEKLIQAKGLFNAAMAGDVNLFKEMRKIKSGVGQMDEMAETVDSNTGEKEIADTFTAIFKTLYNSSENNAEMDDIQRKVKELVATKHSEAEVGR